MKSEGKDASVQTDMIGQFQIQENLDVIKKYFGFGADLRKLKSAKEVPMDIEDHIIDQVLGDRIIFGHDSIFNSWIKPTFVKSRGLSVKNKKLEINIKAHMDIIEAKCHTSYSLEFFLLQITSSMIEVLNHRDIYFTIFNKLKIKNPINMTQGFALFIVWFVDVVHEKIAGFVFDFIILLYLNITNRSVDDEVNNYFIENYLNTQKYPELEKTKNMYMTWIDGDIVFFLEPVELVGYLSDYFIGINIKKFCQH